MPATVISIKTGHVTSTTSARASCLIIASLIGHWVGLKSLFPNLLWVSLLMGTYNIAFHIWLLKLSKPEESYKQLKTCATLQMVMDLFPILAERINQAGGTLSGGEQQMLAVARGLMSIPELLILDEASLGLAPLIVEEIFKVIEQIRSDGVTVLLVEQNVSQALAISDRGYVIEEGRLALSGLASSLMIDPQIKKLYLGMEEMDANVC